MEKKKATTTTTKKTPFRKKKKVRETTDVKTVLTNSPSFPCCSAKSSRHGAGELAGKDGKSPRAAGGDARPQPSPWSRALLED